MNNKTHQHDACYYIIDLESGQIKNGTVNIKLKSIKNVNVFMSGGMDKDNLVINYNSGKELAKTFQSISKIQESYYELIVIDGCSNDESKGLLENSAITSG